MSSSVIKLSDVGLTLNGNAGPTRILHGIELDVKPQETLALVGPSGSGKSSLLMLIGGLEKATQGTVQAMGHDLGTLNEDGLARFRRDHMGIVFQSFHLVPTLTALENVALPLELSHAANALERAQDELAAVGLSDRMGHLPAQLSGGEQQRVALARALAPKPELVLADEPTGNLDSATGEEIADLIFALCRQHATTLILVTHDNELAQRCDRIVGLKSGQISAQP